MTQRRVALGLLLLPLGAIAPLRAQSPCLMLDTTWWQVGATRFFQGSGEGPRSTGIGIERHVVDRRRLPRTATGFRLDILCFKLGLKDTTVTITVGFAPTGAVTHVLGDTGSLSRDVSPLLMLPCAEYQDGKVVADLGARTDTVRTAIQRSVTRATPVRGFVVGARIDTLGQRLVAVAARRTVADTSRG
jgi:hypothetical protein